MTECHRRFAASPNRAPNGMIGAVKSGPRFGENGGQHRPRLGRRFR